MSLRTGLLIAACLLLAACATGGTSGGGTSDDATPGTAPGAGAGAAGDLVVEIDRGDGSPVERYTLVCGDEARGTLPDPAAACAHLAGRADPFAPVPPDAVCTQVYGGPQTASVTGTWQGEPVDLRLARTDGCRIAQWNSLGPLLPGPVGVLDPPG